MKRYIVQHWVAGVHLRGFLPDAEHLLHGVSAEHAVDYIGGELAHVADYTGDPSVARAYTKAWATTQDWDIPNLERLAAKFGDHDMSHGTVFAENYVYWVRPCFIVNCNQIKEN